MVDYRNHFPFLHRAQGCNTHENYALALQMLITILYSLIRDDIYWNEQVADSHWAVLWNAGGKGSPASYLALKIGQPTGCKVPGSGFGAMEVHTAVPLVCCCVEIGHRCRPCLASSPPFYPILFWSLSWSLRIARTTAVAWGGGSPRAARCFCIAGKDRREGFPNLSKAAQSSI